MKIVSKHGAAREAAEVFKTIVFAFMIVLSIRITLFQPFTIPSASMEPNIYKGDYIVVSKYSYGWSRYSMPLSPAIFAGRIFFHSPHRGDIIVFKLPHDNRTDYIKRLIGLPGDRIQVRAGQLIINGSPVPRQAARHSLAEIDGSLLPVQQFWETLPDDRQYRINSYQPDSPVENTGVYVVPPHCYFMMGDNRDNSADSRFDPGISGATGAHTCRWDASIDIPNSGEGVGFVPEENLVGKAQLVLVSWRQGARLFKPWTWLDIRVTRFLRPLN